MTTRPLRRPFALPVVADVAERVLLAAAAQTADAVNPARSAAQRRGTLHAVAEAADAEEGRLDEELARVTT